jgi:hypothetical protein
LLGHLSGCELSRIVRSKNVDAHASGDGFWFPLKEGLVWADPGCGNSVVLR